MQTQTTRQGEVEQEKSVTHPGATLGFSVVIMGLRASFFRFLSTSAAEELPLSPSCCAAGETAPCVPFIVSPP